MVGNPHLGPVGEGLSQRRVPEDLIRQCRLIADAPHDEDIGVGGQQRLQGKLAGSEEPVWPKGAQLAFAQSDREELSEAIDLALQDLGHFFAQFEVDIQRDRKQGIGELVVQIHDAGRRATSDHVEIVGHEINTEEGIRRYLDLRPGTILTRVDYMRLEQRLRDTGRFLQHDVTPIAPKDLEQPITTRISLVEYAEAHDTAGVLTPLIRNTDSLVNPNSARRRPTLLEILWNYGIGYPFNRLSGWRDSALRSDQPAPDWPLEVEVVSGACMMLRRDLLDEIGLLDESTFLYWEEFILCEKMLPTRFVSVMVPGARLTHKRGRSVRTLGLGAFLASIKSCNYYLKYYRHVGPVLRMLSVVSLTARFTFTTLFTTLASVASTSRKSEGH